MRSTKVVAFRLRPIYTQHPGSSPGAQGRACPPDAPDAGPTPNGRPDIVNTPRRCIGIAAICLFVAFLALPGGLFHWNGFLVPLLGKYRAQSSEYLAYSNDIGTVEQSSLYHDIGAVARGVRAADIVILGNSRMQMAWDKDLLREYCGRENLALYNLSCGNGEGFLYYYEYLRKHPFKNKVVLLNVDNYFQNFSGPARQALEGGGAQAVCDFLEKQSFIRIKSVAESLFPAGFLDFFEVKPGEAVLFRSFANGFWNFDNYPGTDRCAIACRDAYKGLAEAYPASSLKVLIDALRRNNCAVILVQAPTTDSSPRDVEEIARLENLPCILYERPYDSLSTFDGSHLCRESAREFTRSVFPRILDAVRRLPADRIAAR